MTQKQIPLTKTQRINLHSLLGSLRPNIGVIRQTWAFMDRLRLTAEEERSINLQRRFEGVQEQVAWDASADTFSQVFPLTEQEFGFIAEAIRSIPGVPADPGTRRWLEPLLDFVEKMAPAK